MNTLLVWSLLTACVVSLCSGVGCLVGCVPEKHLNTATFLMLSAAAGFLLGGAFLHLLPDAMDHFQTQGASMVGLLILGGILLFFVLEKCVRFYLWNTAKSSVYSEEQTVPLATARMSLIGDSLHNFMDGIILSLSFMVSVPAGIATAMAMIAHEIPQELSDVGVIMKGGYSLQRAVFLNFLCSLTILPAVILTFMAGQLLATRLLIIAPIAAGGLIYLAMTDMMPQMQQRQSLKMQVYQVLILFVSIGIMWSISFLEAG